MYSYNKQSLGMIKKQHKNKNPLPVWLTKGSVVLLAKWRLLIPPNCIRKQFLHH